MKNYRFLGILIALVLVFSISDLAHPHPETKFASWNIRILSDKSRDDTELRQIAYLHIRSERCWTSTHRSDIIPQCKRTLNYLS